MKASERIREIAASGVKATLDSSDSDELECAYACTTAILGALAILAELIEGKEPK